jgi:hypothetical protein
VQSMDFRSALEQDHENAALRVCNGVRCGSRFLSSYVKKREMANVLNEGCCMGGFLEELRGRNARKAYKVAEVKKAVAD